MRPPDLTADETAAALHPVHLAATAEEIWQTVLTFLRPRVAHEFIELLLPELAAADASATWERWHRLFPGYIRSRGVTVSRNYLQIHPQARLYTFSEVLREDPGAALELQAENGALPAPLEPRSPPPPPACHDFANLVFWSPRGQMRAMLSICRREEHGPFAAKDHAVLMALYWAVHSALERVARQRAEKARRRCCEQFVASLPIATLFVGPAGELLFANDAAYDLCAMWNFGPQRAVSFNTRACFALPEAISQTIGRLGLLEGRAEGQPDTIRLAHPGIAGLHATVRRELVDEPGAPPAACYLVTLSYLDTFLGADATVPHTAATAAALQALSPAERRVALLARDGLSNKEIAARLGKAVTSVVWTLHVIYPKLGVENRTQLARVLMGTA
ncbi:MAG TPA: helix-turn-helix transcriptional regulator [Opitutaceae bacterium]